MTSSIIRLPMPVEENETVAGWDQTIDHLVATTSRLRTSICTHAMSHECSVYGIRQDISRYSQPAQHQNQDWISWKTSLAPHRVCQVSSNDSGTLIAAALDNGTLSILRGIDGVVLATRRVVPEGTPLPAIVQFVANEFPRTTKSVPNGKTPGDILLILPPDDGPPILVSNMQGDRLNCVENPAIVAEAARNMKLHPLRFEGCDDIRAVQGLVLANTSDDDSAHTVVRLAVVDGDGKLAIYDYDIDVRSPATTLVQRDVDLGNDWDVKFDVGFRVHTVNNSSTGMVRSYLLLALSTPSQTKLCWLDLQDLTVPCEYPVHHPEPRTVSTKARILALEPVASPSPDNSIAVVVAIKFSEEVSAVETRLIQAIFQDNTLMSPHLVYTIPVPPAVQSIATSQISKELPYSFLCKTWSGDDRYDCYAFTTDLSKASVGSVRLHCARQNFNEAMAEAKKSGDVSLSNDLFGRFHPAEIALRRLECILESGNISAGNAAHESQECLQILVEGALSGHKFGKEAFMAAANRILNWPDKKALQNPPSVEEVILVIGGILAALSRVSEVFQGSNDFSTKVAALQEKRAVMQYLHEMLQSSEESQPIPLNDDFAQARHIKDLFALLVHNNFFFAAEKLLMSKMGSKISVESMVSAVLTISPNTHPRRFSSLLTNVVFPRLSIGHELLPPLLSWACHVSDIYDSDDLESERGLDDAIFLLELAERATKDLRLRVHSSFSTSAPFVESLGTKRRKIDHMKGGNISGASLDLSMCSHGSGHYQSDERTIPVASPSEQEWQQTNPTILELGRLKGGAQKARLGQNGTLRVDVVDETEEIVESKLASARCLKRARELGLKNDLVQLGTFANCGGAQYLSRQLVRQFSSTASSHDERVQRLCTQVQSFCKSTDTSFDTALVSYAQELCGGKDSNKNAIEETSSVARCGTTAATKCQVTLIALRAALFCHFSPQWLSDLSKEALEWAAGDSSLRSELEEASRLLLIDGIVGRYCGEGAKELFHVDNPRHAMRLIEFVSRNFTTQSVLADTLNLCDAFAHLSPDDACTRILQNAILQGDEVACKNVLTEIYLRNYSLGCNSFSKAIVFCIDLVEEASSNSDSTGSVTEDFCNAITCAITLTEIALSNINLRANTNRDGFSIVYYDESTLEGLLGDLRRLETLRKEHLLTVSLASLRSPKELVKIVSRMQRTLIEKYVNDTGESATPIVSQIKRACTLLVGSCGLESSALWFAAVGSSACRLVMKSQGYECIRFLADLGILDATHGHLATRSCLAVALTLCQKASLNADNPDNLRVAMNHIIVAISVLQDHTISFCPASLLDKVLATCEVCEVVAHVLARSDEGIGEELASFRRVLQEASSANRWSLSERRSEAAPEVVTHHPVLHSTWYVGDGLLLPPSGTLASALQYCKQALQAPSQIDAVLHLHAFVAGRGSYILGLRLLAIASATQVSTPEVYPSYTAIEESILQTVVALAERYIGGTGNGITSGVIDSELAVSTLLYLPLKVAFKVYRAALPTAIATRAFSRVRTLAHVGEAAGNGSLFPSVDKRPLQNWKRQTKFVEQCQELALRARWWGVLQEQRVVFDPHSFQNGDNSSKQNTQASAEYIKSLIPSLIRNLSRTQRNPEDVLALVVEFAEAFKIGRQIPVQAYVEFLLSEPNSDKADIQCVERSAEDVRLKLARLDSIVKTLLRQLDSPIDRALVLRKCLRRLEDQGTSCDYERLSVVFVLYQAELHMCLKSFQERTITPGKGLVFEVELIDRRRDALAILSWFFQAHPQFQKPAFSSFFAPLPPSWDGEYSKSNYQARLQIINTSTAGASGEFDPLASLDDILASPSSASAASALAPLCLPLGVPRGYVHARALVARFKKSTEQVAALPSFQEDVLPVLNKLENSEAAADLAEWCSLQYHYGDEDKLKCLDHALVIAMKVSTSAETTCPPDSDHETYLVRALERVKRINTAKDLLADRLAINAILSSVGITEEKGRVLNDIVKAVMVKLDEEIWRAKEFVPEYFVEFFLSESSRQASESSLCRKTAISVGQFRDLAMLVNRACRSVADKYSHVQVSTIAKGLTKRWLLYGDDDFKKNSENSALASVVLKDSNKGNPNILPDIEEDDTVNFVMDLNALQQVESVLAGNLGVGCSNKGGTQIASEEEPSCLEPNGSEREASDYASRRSSLRIAFAMAFTEGTSLTSSESTGSSTCPQDENQKPNRKATSSRLLSKLSSTGNRRKNNSVLENSRELLRIVFAKSVASDWVVRDLNTTVDSSRSYDSGNTGHSITFAMRHRAFRAAAILCPQDALEEVIRDNELTDSTVSLRKCSYASFVAKEIEEMGLPLPHSDLSQLSEMHFPSFARTLWRHHRDDKCSKGRLLLLILEMYLREKLTDHAFVISVLHEMDSLSLPRTLLLAFDCIAGYLNRIGNEAATSMLEQIGSELCRIARRLSDKVLKEINERTACESTIEGQRESILRRLARHVQALSGCHSGQLHAVAFIETLINSVDATDKFKEVAGEVLREIVHHVDVKYNKLQLIERAQCFLPSSGIEYASPEKLPGIVGLISQYETSFGQY